MLKYPVPYSSSLEVKEELFASFKDVNELVQSLSFGRNLMKLPVLKCVDPKKRYRRPRELVIQEAHRKMHTLLLVDEASVLKSTQNKSFFRNSRTTKTIEQQDFLEKRCERLLNFPMRVEENRFYLFWRVGHELEENSLVTERSVWKSAKRGSSGLKQAMVVPYFEEK